MSIDRIKQILEEGRDDVADRWDWAVRNSTKWEPVVENTLTYSFQLFYDKWRNTDFPTFNTFPHELDLGSGDTRLPLRQSATSGGTILVTKSYSDLYNRILTSRRIIEGAVITGQPGIGKTMFLNYMLARLLSEKQVVILYTTGRVYLFYQGHVYFRTEAYGILYDLPRKTNYRLWMLVDMDMEMRGPYIDSNLHVWPILASPPNRDRWKYLKKQYRVRVWGMDLWTKEELLRGLRLHPKFDIFIDALKEAWPSQGNVSPPWRIEAAIRRAVTVLQRVTAARETAHATTINQFDGDIVDNALDVLVDDAITEIGCVPRELYAAIFDATRPPNVRGYTLEDLRAIVAGFHHNQSLNADHIMAIRPRSVPNANYADNDLWKIEFVSPRVAHEVMQSTYDKQQDILWAYKTYAQFSEGSAFADWLFELYAHRYLAGKFGWALPGRLPMVADDGDPPCFTFDPQDHDLPAPVVGVPLRRERTIVDFSQPLEQTVVIDWQPRYYEPAVPHNTLFDSFTIDHDEDENSAVITVFQITKSREQGGTADGYQAIRQIMAHVRAFLQHDMPAPKQEVKVTVEYVLVCPSPPQECSWQMPPAGWRKHDDHENHRGKAYCLHLSV